MIHNTELNAELNLLFPNRICIDPSMQEQAFKIHGLALALLVRLRKRESSSTKYPEITNDASCALKSLRIAQKELTSMMSEQQTAKVQAVENRIQIVRIYLLAGCRSEAVRELEAILLFMFDPQVNFPLHTHHIDTVFQMYFQVSANT